MPAKRSKAAELEMLVERLNDTELAILEALAVYRFLTPAQLHRLGVTRNMSHLYGILGALLLRKPAIVRRLELGVLPGLGRAPALYFLTPRGAELLAVARRDEAPVAVPTTVRLFRRDYLHRLGCVDFHIALRRWAERHGATVDLFDTYFEYGTIERGMPRPKTRIALRHGALEPDAIVCVTAPDGVPRLFAFELYNRRETGRVERQLSAYLHALDQEAIERAYNYPHAVRVLCAFEDERGLELAAARLRSRPEFAAFGPYFLFKTLAEARADPAHGWRQLDQPRGVNLFPQLRRRA